MYFLIGKSLCHSFSAEYFNKKFSAEKIDNHYELCELENITCLFQLIDNLIKKGDNPEGFNVTIPYKESIIPYLDKLTERAATIKAVNTVRIDVEKDKYILTGDNTDAVGFTDAICQLLTGNETNALILGTGGASKAVIYALEEIGVNTKSVSRVKGKGDLTYSELTERGISDFDIIINCTPLGTFPKVNECPPIPYSGIKQGSICFDLVYNPSETMFMNKCKMEGAIVSNGLGMLYGQASAAWNFWQNRGL